MGGRAALVLSMLLLAGTARAQDRDDAHQQEDADTSDPCASVRRGSPEADVCAQRAYATAQASQRPLPAFVPPAGTALSAALESIATLIHDWGAITSANAGAFEPVIGYRVPRWALRAYVAQGARYDELAAAIVEAGGTLARARGWPPDVLTRRLRGEVQQIECLAIVRYVLTIRAARVGAMYDDGSFRFALARLHYHGQSQITQCMFEQRQHDPTFSPWDPGELIELPPDASSLAPLDGPGPPPLAPAEP